MARTGASSIVCRHFHEARFWRHVNPSRRSVCRQDAVGRSSCHPVLSQGRAGCRNAADRPFGRRDSGNV